MDHVHFGVLADFMTVNGPRAVRPDDRRAATALLESGAAAGAAAAALEDRAPLMGHPAVSSDRGPLISLLYKYVRRNIRNAFARPSHVDVTNSPTLALAVGSAPPRRGTAAVLTRIDEDETL